MNSPHLRPTRAECLSTVILGAIITLTACGCVGGVLLARALGASPSLLVFLAYGSFGYLIAGTMFWLTRPSWYGTFITIGLLLCLGGDASLYYGSFLVGGGSFLVAHIMFIMAFFALRASRSDPAGEYACGARHGFFGAFSWRRLAVAIPVMTLISLSLAFWILPRVENAREMVLVVSYMVVITTMVVFSGGVRDTRMRAIAFLAAILFYTSDIFVAEGRYVKVLEDIAYYCYPLYYAACFLFAWSVGVHNLSRGEKNQQSTADHNSRQ